MLDVIERGEADRHVVLLTATGERVAAHAPAAARSRKRFGGALQPGARIHARWSVQREGGLAVLEETQLVHLPPAPDPLERYYVLTHVLEVCGAFAREGQEDPRLYRLLEAAVERLAAGDALEPLARYVESWALRLAGWMPGLGECAACGAGLAGRSLAIAAERGAFCPEHAPVDARRISAAAARWLVDTAQLAPAALPALPAAVNAELSGVLQHSIRGVTERPLTAWTALLALRRHAAQRDAEST